MLFCLIIVQSNARNLIFMTLYAYKGSIIILQAQLIAYNLAFFPPIMRLFKKQEFTQQEHPYELTLCSRYKLLAYDLNFPSAPRIAQNPPRSTSLEFERCRKQPKMATICQDNRNIFPWSVDHRCCGRSTKHPMVGRASTLWSVDHRPYGRSTKRLLNEMGQNAESLVNDFCTKGPKCAILIF